jgi:hypothetical protein
MFNVVYASAPSPSIPLSRGEREAKPLSLDGGVAQGQREVGETVLVKRSLISIAARCV